MEYHQSPCSQLVAVSGSASNAGNMPRAHIGLDLCRVETGLFACGWGNQAPAELDICSLARAAALCARNQTPSEDCQAR
jgi:hypothetical protein